ncbi:pilus assembly protein PilZ [Sphingobium sp. SCG-1]|uniref:PilZ domain-containing protein n=1 Tax=Sphingobium sp. SCG-1 TaxID=2072936 RepID=UPI000CD685DD|nr:PilZ domain-containing protein [Sphingobium sp. SCG-1]AUW59399.1 pilus assembly protein PilZ [Sphingobium sp. SCG-1]
MSARQNIKSGYERTDTRHHVQIGVKLRRPGESWFSSRISDLSATGFRVQTFVKLKPGMDIWIMLPGFEGRRAEVMWVRDHEAGCNFERPLHPAIFDHIVKITTDALGLKPL